MRQVNPFIALALLVALLLLSSCGGSGGGADAQGDGGDTPNNWDQMSWDEGSWQ